MKSVAVTSSSSTPSSSSVAELFIASSAATAVNGSMPLPTTVAINSTRRAFIHTQNDPYTHAAKMFTFEQSVVPTPSPPHAVRSAAAASANTNGIISSGDADNSGSSSTTGADAVPQSAFAQALASTRNLVPPPRQELPHNTVHLSSINGVIHASDLQSRHRPAPNLHIQSRSVDSTPLPSPAHFRNGVNTQQAISSQPSTQTTSRLPPRVPTLPNLSRMATASSTASTDSMFFNHHPLPHSTPHFTSPIDYATSVPSLSDLVSPSEPVVIPYDTWRNGAANRAGDANQQRVQQKAIAANHGAATVPTTPHASNSTILQLPPSYMSSFATSPPSQLFSSPNPMDDIPIAWRELLSRQESVDYIRADPAVHALIATGVPHSIRGELWKLLSGSLEERRRYPRSYYSKLLALHKIKGSIYDDEIRRDLARTLPAVDMFNPRKQPEGDTGPSIPPPSATPVAPPPPTQFAWNGTGGLARLNRVLCAYATRNKTLGYCQGMNMLAGTLLTLLNEEDAFWILVTIIENRIGYYAKSMCGLEVDQCVFGSLVNYFLPHLGDHLRQFDVTIPSFTVSWFVCLFVEAPLNQLHQIYPTWDHLFCKGDEFLFSMSLALLQYKEREILKKKETGELLEFLLHSGFRRSIPDSPVQSFTDPTGNTPAIASPTPHPLDIHFLLQTAIPRLGSLSREISSLREYHRNVILTKSKTLNIHNAQRLATLYKYPNSDEIQKLWNVFLSPAPWSILLHGSLTSLVKFYEAFCVHIFPDAIRRKWRDQGLFSGVVERLFQTIDSEHSGEISFEQFLAAVYLFTKGEQEEKYRFVFRFYDTDFDGMISAAEMKKVFILFHRMYNGATIGTSNSLTADEAKAALALQQKLKNSIDGEFVSEQPPSATPVATVDEVMNGDDSDAISSMFVSMMFQKAAELIVAQASKAAAASAASTAATTTITPVPTVTSVLTSLYSTGMGYSHFRRVISLHPFTQLTFGLTIHESQSARQQLARTNAVEAANAQATGPSPSPAPPSVPPQPLPTPTSASSAGILSSGGILATPRSRRGSTTGLPLANGNPNAVALPSASSTPLIVARKVSMTTTSAPPALTAVPSAVPPSQ